MRGIHIINQPAIAPLPSENSQVKQLRTLFFTFLWFIALLIIPQFILGALFGMGADIQQVNNSADVINSSTVTLLLLISLCSPIITIPILYFATKKKTWRDCLRFLALHKVNSKVAIVYLIATLLFYVGTTILGIYLNLSVEQFVLDVKNSMENGYILLLALVTICFVMPIMEELIFRGWLFTQIAQTKLGKLGALVLTSLIFTLIHGQYDQEGTFIVLFLAGLLFGFMRYKHNNVSYAVFAHILFNSLAMASLFFVSQTT